MQPDLIGWRSVAELTGVSADVLRQASHRGTLPLPERWERGQRVFVKSEVEAWMKLRKENAKT